MLYIQYIFHAMPRADFSLNEANLLGSSVAKYTPPSPNLYPKRKFGDREEDIQTGWIEGWFFGGGTPLSSSSQVLTPSPSLSWTYLLQLPKGSKWSLGRSNSQHPLFNCFMFQRSPSNFPRYGWIILPDPA